jgi:hypothetical protein
VYTSSSQKTGASIADFWVVRAALNFDREVRTGAVEIEILSPCLLRECSVEAWDGFRLPGCTLTIGGQAAKNWVHRMWFG